MIARFCTALPDRLVLLFLCAVGAVGPLTTFGQFRVYLVLPLFLLLAALSWRVLPAATSSASGDDSTAGKTSGWQGPVIALIIAVAWIGVNAVFRSEFFIVVRDPAIYTLRSLWLVDHISPNIDVSQAARGAHGVAGSFTDSAGFPTVGSSWQAQGSSLVPALIATFGWIAGTQGVLGGNVVIGAVGLITVYALARRIVGSIWALVPMLGLAVSMPMVAFSRAPYTEPTALVLGIGGLVLVWISLDTGRLALAAVGGLSIGATFLARPDGLLFVIGGVLALGFIAVLARDPGRRTEHRTRLVAFILGAGLSTGLALVDLARNSSVYEAGTFSSIRSLLLVAIAVAIVLPALSYLPGAGGVRRALADSRVGGARVTVTVVLLGFAALALRPLYYTAHTSATGASAVAGIRSIANRQAAEGLAVDGSRTYDEQSVTWLSWYYSWPAVIMAAVGTCVALGLTWRRRDARFVGVLAVFGVASALYLNRVQITPDQIWAMRRFLPIIVPAGLILATLVPVALWRTWPKLRPIAVLAAAVMIVAPLSTWRRTLITREYGGAKAFVASLCNSVNGTDVIIADQGSGGTIFLPALRIECGVSAVLLVNPTPASLNAVRSNWADGRPVSVIAFVSKAVPWRAVPAQPFDGGLFDVWTEPLSSRPIHVTKTGDQLWVGSLAADGLVDARTPA